MAVVVVEDAAEQLAMVVENRLIGGDTEPLQNPRRSLYVCE